VKNRVRYHLLKYLVGIAVLPLGLGAVSLRAGETGETAVPHARSVLEEARRDISPEEWDRMERGEVITLKETERREGKVFIQAALIFQQPVEEVHALLSQTERQEEYLPHLDRSILIERTGNRDRVEFLLDFGFINIRYRVRHYYGEPGEFRTSWYLDPDFENDLKEMEGHWDFYRVDDRRTLARYGTRVRIGRLVPKFIEKILTRRDLPKSLGQLKQWVESGGTWRKEEYREKESTPGQGGGEGNG